MIYAGIGSRQTPEPILTLMTKIGALLGKKGWTLRSGAAPGADRAFEAGCNSVNGKCEIFLPWRFFNAHPSSFYEIDPKAIELAKEIHPAFNNLNESAKKLIARNCHQILGEKLNSPVKIVICWTPKGKLVGGTATGIRLAQKFNIPVMNLATTAWTYENLDA